MVYTVLTAFDNMGFIANMVSMVLYFMYVMHFDLSNSATTLTNFMGTTFLLSLVGGFISDTYLSRFTTCIIFGIVEILVKEVIYNSNLEIMRVYLLYKLIHIVKNSVCMYNI